MPQKVEKKSLITKALTRGEPENLDKDEVLDLIFWIRAIIGLVVGLVAGILGLTGFPVIMTFIASLFGGSYFYYSKFLEVDTEDYNENELLMEGVGNGGGLFMLAWIIMYTYM